MSSSDDSSEVSASPSPPASPQDASQPLDLPNLEQLTHHFIQAKRSLAANVVLHRASELVEGSRALIEELAVLHARNSYARRGVDEQMDTLHAIRDGMADVADSAVAEFKLTVAAIDKAHGRLEKTLKVLRDTLVDASLQRTPRPAQDRGGQEDLEAEEHDEDDTAGAGSSTQQKTLYDFIQESTHSSLESSLRSLVDDFQRIKATLDTSLHAYDDRLQSITSLLTYNSPTNSHPSSAPKTLYGDDDDDDDDNHNNPTPTPTHLFRTLSTHAAEMATMFTSLIKHYDLCITALKHTEGGPEAAKRALQAFAADPLPTPHSPTQDHPSPAAAAAAATTEEETARLDHHTPPSDPPLSPSTHTSILHVLASDAAELPSVLTDLHAHAADTESTYAHLTRHAVRARHTHTSLHHTLSRLHSLHATRLPALLRALHAFRADTRATLAAMRDRTGELAELAAFYEGFAGAYERVLGEVARRREVERGMRRVAVRAQRELEGLWWKEREAREGFLKEVGGWVPRDLWPEAGVVGGRRWVVREVGGDEVMGVGGGEGGAGGGMGGAGGGIGGGEGGGGDGREEGE